MSVHAAPQARSQALSADADDHVDWPLARRVAVRVAGDEPLYRSYLQRSLREDFARFVPVAEQLVAVETGLVPDAADASPARACVIDRAGWIDANINSFRRLLAPVLAHMEGGSNKLTRRASAVELGAVLGWMSRRVLGQYDVLIASEDDAVPGAAAGADIGAASTPGACAPRPPADASDGGDGDVVYFVGPNILLTEKRFAFTPAQFRLWLALHELTHRSQFTGVPWLRSHFLGLVNGLLSDMSPDPQRLRDGVQRMIADRRSGRDPLASGGLAAVFATDEQREVIDQVGGMMSLVEGHGDVTMSRAAAGHVPEAESFAHVMSQRRGSSRGLTRLMQRLLGIEAKLAQYRAGESFIEAIESERGLRAVDRIWERPEHLPTLEEISAPRIWLERVPAAA